jgi:hypothetical protein
MSTKRRWIKSQQAAATPAGLSCIDSHRFVPGDLDSLDLDSLGREEQQHERRQRDRGRDARMGSSPRRAVSDSTSLPPPNHHNATGTYHGPSATGTPPPS